MSHRSSRNPERVPETSREDSAGRSPAPSTRKFLTLALGLGIVLASVLGIAPAAQAQSAPGYYP